MAAKREGKDQLTLLVIFGASVSENAVFTDSQYSCLVVQRGYVHNRPDRTQHGLPASLVSCKASMD